MKLSVQIIADYLQNHCVVSYSTLAQELLLYGIREYKTGQPVLSQYIYILEAKDVPPKGSFIIIGGQNEENRADCINLPQTVTIAQAMVWGMEAFEMYTQWALSLQYALNRDCEIDELLKLSLSIFKNPMFVHDSDFYLLAMAGSTPNPTDWSYEDSSGRYIFNNDLISLYKLDENYLNSLKLKYAAVFPMVIREYVILICNLWQDDKYIARICINAVNSEVKKGQLKLVEQLADVVLVALRRQIDRAAKPQRDISVLLAGMLSGNTESRVISQRMLAKQGWEENDCYIFYKIELSRWDDYVKSIFATCFKLESLVRDCLAFPYENDIAVIVNLTKNGCTPNEVSSILSPFLRESLLKMGCSNTFQSFFQASEYFLQATAALEIGMKHNEMSWSFQFENYVMEYILKYGCSRIPANILCSRDVIALAEYDESNNTRLSETLRVYIANNLNSVATAKELYIHRSTFFYRLDRIKSIVKANLKDYHQRMYIQMSFLLLNEFTIEK